MISAAAAEHDEQGDRLRPRLLEADLRHDRLAGTRRLDAHSISQIVGAASPSRANSPQENSRSQAQ